MIRDTLSHYFEGVAYKRLSAVEASRSASNQHEFNGDKRLRELLGPDRQAFSARFVYVSDDDEDSLSAEGTLTWYDARERHPSRSEYRLYFPDNPPIAAAVEGDLLVIAKRPDDTILVVIAPARSTTENQVLWLFGVSDDPQSDLQLKDLSIDSTRLTAVRMLILEQVGIEVETTDDNFLDLLLDRFPDGFPGTREFSVFARGTIPGASRELNPDAVLLAWWEREEVLFKTLERHLLEQRIRRGFDGDVDGFIAFSMSIHQTRRSRAGRALENHVEQILVDHEIRYARGSVTENGARPDFLFPGTVEYRNPGYPAERLTMLGVKSTCKDRWRQVLAESVRIEEKHLFTLEPGISVAQTNEMQANRLRLVLPEALHVTYKPEQRQWLVSLANFIALVRDRQH